MSSNQRPSKKARIASSPSWNKSDCGTLLYLHHPDASTSQATKVAGFDIDGTIIATKSGKTFAKNENDWKLWAGATVMKPIFAGLVKNGYRIVFFTNQEGISKGKVNEESWTKKVENVIDALGLSYEDGGVGVTVMASLTKKGNDYRKPHVGMWTFLCDKLIGDGTVIDKNESFYCGDAAGRPKRGIVKKDFSCTDYKFALNVGLTFQTPEEVFYKSTKPSEKASLKTSKMDFQPKEHWRAYFDDDTTIDQQRQDFLSSCCSNKKEMIVVVGSPASGKSELTRRVVGGNEQYVRVNQDTLKTLNKCVKVATQTITDGKSVIIDNTNRDKKTRSNYIQLAKDNNVPCRCVYMTTTKEETFHMNALRGAIGDVHSDDKRSIPDMVIHMFYKNVETPTVSEGFEEVIELPFTPGPFDSVDRKDAFFRFTH